MVDFRVLDPDYEGRVRESFARQTALATLGATMERVAPGEVVISMPYHADLAQQHGFLHAGIITTIVDSACGYAALTLMPVGAEVPTVEYKVNFLAPAEGERFTAVGRVVKPGRTLSVCLGEVSAVNGGRERTIVTMLATMIRVSPEGRTPGSA